MSVAWGDNEERRDEEKLTPWMTRDAKVMRDAVTRAKAWALPEPMNEVKVRTMMDKVPMGAEEHAPERDHAGHVNVASPLGRCLNCGLTKGQQVSNICGMPRSRAPIGLADNFRGFPETVLIKGEPRWSQGFLEDIVIPHLRADRDKWRVRCWWGCGLAFAAGALLVWGWRV